MKVTIFVFLTILHSGLPLSCYQCDKELCKNNATWSVLNACGTAILPNKTAILDPNPGTAIDFQQDVLENFRLGVCVSAQYTEIDGKTYTVKSCIIVNTTDPKPENHCETYLNQPTHGQVKPLYRNVRHCHICRDKDMCNSGNLRDFMLFLPVTFLFNVFLFI
ncbi:uncharacterized protein LOC126740650 [Anthonomus grandis grandis]|uniref:uncharacterized protein LOC126740650 n=1 Tax=Anthonomus grandis grandis TaxID=2921223 RepID=UPI0021651B53|nr:uncharacterized protein LOC126740650 [Anthonomus grandis grandis]